MDFASSSHVVNPVVYYRAGELLRHLHTTTDHIHRVSPSFLSPRVKFLCQCTALQNFSRCAGNLWSHVRQRYQLHPFPGGIRSSWPASTLVQSSREILYATLQHTASSNATDNSRAPSLTPARYGPADHLQPIACTTGPHHFQPPSSTSEARRPASLPTQLSRLPGLDPTAARLLRAAHADHQQPTAHTTASHRFQQLSSQSKARRLASLPTHLSRPPGWDPTAAQSLCTTPAR
jgi:hypothetical protein